MSKLDFLVIGAQKAGTTTLWQLLRDHPQLELPGAKEVPFFANDRLYAMGMEHYEATYFGEAKPGVLRGSVSPQYMFDTPTVAIGEIASRIARELPQVKLVALLRDPIERAISHHRMSVRHGYERRPVEEALRQQLSLGALEAARRPVKETAPPEARRRVYANSRYIAAGEYGRLLTPYRQHFETSQLLVLLTSELESDPDALLGRMLHFLGVEESWRPTDVRAHHLVGGDTVRVQPEDIDTLRRLLAAVVPDAPIGAFEVALDEWNTLAGPPNGQLPPSIQARLSAHFAADASALGRLWGVTVPWLASPQPAPRGEPQPRRGPTRIIPGRLAGADLVASKIKAALEEGTGFALVRIDVHEAVLLGHEIWPVLKPNLAVMGVRDGSDAAAALRQAIADADAVSVITDRERSIGAALLEQALAHFDLRPRLLCEPTVNGELLAGDPSQGAQASTPQLHRVLKGHRLAAVCPAAMIDRVKRGVELRALSSPEDQAHREDLNFTLAVALDDTSEVESVFLALAIQREAYDAVLVLGEAAAKPLCVRLARELDLVALDLGRPLSRFLHPSYYNLASAPGLARTRWEVAEYLRQASAPNPDPDHELEGRLIRQSNGEIFYVERGRTRRVTHPALLKLFDHEPIDVAPDAIVGLLSGAPLAAVHERFTEPFVLLDGRKRPLRLELPVVELDAFSLKDIPEGQPVPWHPNA